MATKTSVYVEVSTSKYDVDTVMKNAVKDFKKNNKVELKNINLYIKPEDGKAYYTANNDKVAGSVDL